MRQSVHIFRRIGGAALALLVMLVLPTGWLYDLVLYIGFYLPELEMADLTNCNAMSNTQWTFQEKTAWEDWRNR